MILGIIYNQNNENQKILRQHFSEIKSMSVTAPVHKDINA